MPRSLHAAAMLLVPFKKAPAVDLVQPVTFYVEANYSPEPRPSKPTYRACR